MDHITPNINTIVEEATKRAILLYPFNKNISDIILIKLIEMIKGASGDVGTDDNNNNALSRTIHPKIVPKYSFIIIIIFFIIYL